MEFLLVIPVLLVVGLGFFLGLPAIYRRARRKGYRAPGALLAVLATVVGAIALTLPFLRRGANLGPIQFILVEFGLPITVFLVLGVILVAVLPKRSARIAGERHARFPFVFAGWIVVATAFFVLALELWLWLSARLTSLLAFRGLWLAGALFALGRYLVRRGKAVVSQPVLESVLANDSRPPVLYLRAFKQESQAFAVGDASKYGSYVEGWQRVAIPGQRVEVPFEQYFHGSIETSLGPFVALGSPEDYIPPHGAVRHYATDETWQTELALLAKKAGCIVAEVNTAGNLRWEYEHLRSHGYQKKLFFFSLPEDAAAPWRSALGRTFGRVRGLTPPVDWETFASELGSLRYKLSPDDPGPGSLITFDGYGRQVLLTTEADLPEEFIEPLEAWLLHKKKSGRCTPVSCTTCGCTFHVHAENADTTPLLCRQCRSPHRSSRRIFAGILSAAMGIFGYAGYSGNLNGVFGSHPVLLTTLVLAILAVILLFVIPYEESQP